MTEEKICISCKHKVVNDPAHTTFSCPQCTKHEIVRCSQCRVKAINYACPQCNFSGPN